MAKTIKDASLEVSNSNATMMVHATVVMPIAEYEAFIALGDLTNAVPAHVTAFIAERLAVGATSGQ